MTVIGTAGHVDHGKSALVEALTGTHPDRLPEEKAREMTIDLGFGWLTLPSKREVGIVDVPGHERFVKNMLAGVTGVDLVLLVVAANEGVRPQTREHLAIIDLLGIETGIVVITKMDLVDTEWLQLVTMEISDSLRGTTLARAPLVPVSAVSGAGIVNLLSAIDSTLDTIKPRRDLGRPRLPIDRVFSMAGFGTVATGTLTDGTLTVDDEIDIVPSGLRSRIRGLQTHRKKVTAAKPGTRLAVNVAGLEVADLRRGDVLTRPGWLRGTTAFDARIRALASLTSPLQHNAPVTVYCGTAETSGKIRLLDRTTAKAGDEGWAQIVLDRPVALVKGDRFIIRSTAETLGGGEVVEVRAARHPRFRNEVLDGLASRQSPDVEDNLRATIEAAGSISVSALVERAGVSLADGAEALRALAAAGAAKVLGQVAPDATVLSPEHWMRLSGRAAQALTEYHRQFPLRPGMAREELRSKLKLPPAAFVQALRLMADAGAVAESDGAVRLSGFHSGIPPAQQPIVAAFLQSSEKSPYSSSTEDYPDAEVVSYLVGQGKLVRLAEGLVMPKAAYDDAVRKIRKVIGEQGKVTIAQIRDLFATNRKFALALAATMDREGITRRVGDERVLR